MSSKSSCLNLWDVETKTSKFDVDVHETHIDFTCTGSQKLVFTPVCDIGSVSDVSATIQAMEATQISDDTARQSEIATNVAAIAAETVSRQSGDSALSAQVGQEVSDRAAGDVANAAAIAAEQTRAEGAEAVLTAAVYQEVSDRQAAISAENSRAVAAEAVLQAAIDALGQFDVQTLVQIQSVIQAYTQADTSILTTLADLETRLAAAEATVAALTTP